LGGDPHEAGGSRPPRRWWRLPCGPGGPSPPRHHITALDNYCAPVGDQCGRDLLVPLPFLPS
jgi:hypothetical protein